MLADTPKQYLQVAGMTLLEHSLQALLADARIRAVSVVVRAGDGRASQLGGIAGNPRVSLAIGGDERSDSVAAGLDDLLALGADVEDWVLVHDAARPCLPQASLAALMEQVLASGRGGILAQPVPDTVKKAFEGQIAATIDRRDLWLAQTPQMFRLGELRSALSAARREGRAVTDEASAMECSGAAVQLVSSPRRNLKVTTPEDIELVKFYLQSEN
ncbi:2-C-methyl-D-erythritol 4-phosphate cytidylyltransferase [Chromatocurvus halotolerans]|uniref:2-C-methyl-D-erythritol 4-phosphate cytidylyltransferase n=2 Tax=Chromatocurvus halotolerans TaxID=1132028 RepID=A0A4V2SC06_9GAMM|nr:2-C-methyl-D-erythritol 4-phosphate cytidylyltransferase [Chromatocurvus halotolerans]